jgi:dTDP-4-amino-4,6-dideoxygalactose transaminase
MKVEFYGHVRQYKNIQSEIDANMQQVLLSGQYVQGPMLKRFLDRLMNPAKIFFATFPVNCSESKKRTTKLHLIQKILV